MLKTKLYGGKIELKKINGVIYYDKDNTDCDCWNLYDEEKKFIDTFYGSNIEMLEFAEKIENITNIYDLVDLGLSINMIFATSLEELYQDWLNYIFVNDDEEDSYTFEEFKELPINRVGQNYFIMNYTEI